jgi:hypothetical protein
MSWRTITAADIQTALSPDEFDVLTRALGANADTILADTLSLWAEDIRGAVRTGGATVDATDATVPTSILRRIIPAIVQTLSTRAGGVLPDPKGLRAKAAEAAETFLRDQVAAGKWSIETPTVAESGSASSVVLGPAHTHKTLEIQRTDQAGV